MHKLGCLNSGFLRTSVKVGRIIELHLVSVLEVEPPPTLTFSDLCALITKINMTFRNCKQLWSIWISNERAHYKE